MKPLNLVAASPEELIFRLRATDIEVPLVTEGRTKVHRERFIMARFLATVARSSRLRFPFELRHGEKPDFVLCLREEEVGAECVEAVPQDLYEIEVLREKHYPDAFNSGQMFLPGEQTFSWEEKHEIASGERAGPPWMPKTARRNWIAAMFHFARGKTEKLRQGNYSPTPSTWLLIQDEWPTSLRFYPDQLLDAASELSGCLASLLNPPSFHAIFILSGGKLLSFEQGKFAAEEVRNVWASGQ